MISSDIKAAYYSEREREITQKFIIIEKTTYHYGIENSKDEENKKSGDKSEKVAYRMQRFANVNASPTFLASAENVEDEKSNNSDDNFVKEAGLLAKKLALMAVKNIAEEIFDLKDDNDDDDDD
ncbi:hypothetical protein O0L34_g6014 [Tuta absoluta]|nr:hypothetical protein O0L34_g6014 [Tuta absoluta]